jgi:hypothetical protein
VIDSFDGFFEAAMEQPFAVWAELELTYQFAKQHAPKLLEGGTSDAKTESRKRQMDAAIEMNGLMQNPGGDRKSGTTKSSLDLSIDSQAERARKNGISKGQQEKLDALARRAPAFLE